MNCKLLASLQEAAARTGIKLGNTRPGRITGLISLDVHVDVAGLPRRIASITLFCGRRYYRPWIEVYNIQPYIHSERGVIPFLDSRYESDLLDVVSKPLGPAEPLFIEYYRDEETLHQLEQGVPVIATRLGYQLYKRGFTWFKVWYYPEGFYEGGQKIQAEKPASRERMLQHVKQHLEEIREFVARRRSGPQYIILALLRARRLERELSKLLA